MPKVTLAASAEKLLDAWFAPWEGVHPSWDSGIEQGYSLAARRLTYSKWCHALNLAQNPPQWMLGQLSDIDLPLPMPHQAQEMACFVGAVVWAGTPSFLSAWVANQAGLLGMMDMGHWREALRWQRTRQTTLLSSHVTQVSTSVDLRHIGLSALRAAVEGHWPGMWSRLKLRFDREMIAYVEAMEACTPAQMSVQDRRHVLGAWRLAAHLQSH